MSEYPFNLNFPIWKMPLERRRRWLLRGTHWASAEFQLHARVRSRPPARRAPRVCLRLRPAAHLTLLAVARCRRRRASPGPQLTSQTHAPTRPTKCLFTFAVTRAHRPSLRAGPDHPGIFTAVELSLLRGLDLRIGWTRGASTVNGSSFRSSS